MRRTATLLIAVGALAAPAGALAAPRLAAPIPQARPAQASVSPTTAPLDVASDRVALTLYASYLLTLLKQAPTGQVNDTTYIATISGSGGCGRALAPLAQTGTQLDAAERHTLNLLGFEIGDDLSINFDLAALAPFTHFAAGLANLRWTRGSGGLPIVRRYIRAENNVLNMSPSGLCQDALLAAATPELVPAGTTLFLRQYGEASRAANGALAGLMRLMQSYADQADRSVVGRVGVLAREITSTARADLTHSGMVLTAALES